MSGNKTIVPCNRVTSLCLSLSIYIYIYIKVKVKVKFTLEQAVNAPRGGSEGIAVLFLLPWRLVEAVGQRHAPGRCTPNKKTWCILHGMIGGPQAGLDRCWKSHPPPGFDPRTVQPVAKSLSLYVCMYVCIQVIDDLWALLQEMIS